MNSRKGLGTAASTEPRWSGVAVRGIFAALQPCVLGPSPLCQGIWKAPLTSAVPKALWRSAGRSGAHFSHQAPPLLRQQIPRPQPHVPADTGSRGRRRGAKRSASHWPSCCSPSKPPPGSTIPGQPGLRPSHLAPLRPFRRWTSPPDWTVTAMVTSSLAAINPNQRQGLGEGRGSAWEFHPSSPFPAWQ